MFVQTDFFEIDISTIDVGIDQMLAHLVADIHSLDISNHPS